MVKIEIRGINQVNNYLKGKVTQIDKDADKGINKATLFMQGEVKESIAGRRNEPTSVDTGRFLNSVDITTSKDFGVVFSDVSYAKYLEHGTSRLRPRKHFSNSKDRNQNKIKEIIEKEINV